ncbi:hypothetical protein MMB68_13715 [Priestia sp. Y58]|uniref:hypothetical protein n=1 Tax=Priestia sp. Y58 TaxID=2922804 RepID=UPI0024075737|nr:hypothetical protein [Priestia sp. Y58]MDG0030615.1 hypothetical protein [Priestia sp. Y58]
MAHKYRCGIFQLKGRSLICLISQKSTQSEYFKILTILSGGNISKDFAKKTKELLHSVEFPIIGIILNNKREQESTCSHYG